MLFKQTISTIPFKQWLLSNAENKRLLWFSAIVMLISFGWLKYLYPYPNFMPPDSFNYIEAANNNDFINMWPIGYSKFLRLISVFTHSDVVLGIIQYLLLIAGVLYFLFTIRYLLSPGKWLFRTILIIIVANPLLPHIANFVSSDCLFASISLVWFSQLLWILYRANSKLLLLHAIVVLLAFMTRFTAIYYPVVSMVVIFLAHMTAKTRSLGMGAIAVLLLCFIGRTQYEYKIKTGTVQYSAFGGWQLAANALYGYAWAKKGSSEYIPHKFRELHAIVNKHMDSISHLTIRPDVIPGIYYLWDFKSPLLLYLYKSSFQTKKTFFEHWASVAPLYNKYGRWLTVKYPISYLKHYAWPNLLRYYSPPPYFMGSYNLGKKSVDPIAASWFNWKNNQISNRLNSSTIHIMNVFPTLLAIINPAFMFCILFFLFFAGFRQCNVTGKHIILCSLLVWGSNTLFSVLSAPIELRYQIFPIVITISFLLLFISWLMQSVRAESTINKKQIYSNIELMA
jgi:hypothetical protein